MSTGKKYTSKEKKCYFATNDVKTAFYNVGFFLNKSWSLSSSFKLRANPSFQNTLGREQTLANSANRELLPSAGDQKYLKSKRQRFQPGAGIV